MVVITDIREARRIRCMGSRESITAQKVIARRRHRHWAKQETRKAARVGEADHHRRPFLCLRWLDRS